MAGDWIKIQHVTPDKPEVDQLAHILSIDHDTVTGKLVRLWIWADQQSVDGNALNVTETMLDRITFMPGFAAALRKVGWLEGRDGRLLIPNFSQHNGQTAKKRAATNQRVSRHRAQSNAPSVTDVTPEPLQKALPEKRREENIKKTSSSPPISPRGGCPTVGELIHEIPSTWPQKRRQAATDWAEDKQSRSLKKQRYQSLRAWRANLKRMELYHPEILYNAVQCAMASGWQGWEQESVKATLSKPSQVIQSRNNNYDETMIPEF